MFSSDWRNRLSEASRQQGRGDDNATILIGSSKKGNKLVRVRPETVFLPDLGVMLKKLSSEYQIYACGNFFRMP
jgi:hypothetical protein